MKNLNILFLMYILPSMLLSQGLFTITTDKFEYSYGEVIEVSVSIYNDTDSIIYFRPECGYPIWLSVKGVEFIELHILGDGCERYLIPGEKETWDFKLDPEKLGFPVTDGLQTIYASGYDHIDSLSIVAPKFFGGRIKVVYSFEDEKEKRDSFFHSINATVIDIDTIPDTYLNRSEIWSVDGSLIDTLIYDLHRSENNFGNVSTFRLFEQGYKTIIPGPNKQAQKYFPLDIGNTWFYEKSAWNTTHKDTFAISVIGDTLMPNNMHYYILNRALDPAELLSPYVRTDSLSIYFFDIEDSSDTPVYNFDTPLGEWYKIGLYATEFDSPRVWLNAFDTAQIFGDTVDVVSFYLDWLVPFDLRFSDKFGPLGWYSAHHEPISTRLIGCKISGLEYGIIVGLENEKLKLRDFNLEQNYPNPFNPSTSISYNLPHPTQVRLTVFNLSGQHVATIDEGYKSAGQHKTLFNATGLASGVYYYQLKAGQTILTRKLVFLK